MKTNVSVLITAMADNGYTARRLAPAANVSTMTIARMLTGARVRPDTYKKIADALNVRPSDLIVFD